LSAPQPAAPGALALGILRAADVPLEEVLSLVGERLGPVTHRSAESAFVHSSYYDGEMGGNPLRCYVGLAGQWDPGLLAEVKLAANELEARWSRSGERRVNLDPGTLNLVQFVLASGKPAAHRVYVGRGIYAEIEYLYERGTFRPLPWTYADYAEPAAVAFFNQLRERHRLARKEAE
jgi:hypothetical protein